MANEANSLLQRPEPMCARGRTKKRDHETAAFPMILLYSNSHCWLCLGPGLSTGRIRSSRNTPIANSTKLCRPTASGPGLSSLPLGNAGQLGCDVDENVLSLHP